MLTQFLRRLLPMFQVNLKILDITKSEQGKMGKLVQDEICDRLKLTCKWVLVCYQYKQMWRLYFDQLTFILQILHLSTSTSLFSVEFVHKIVQKMMPTIIYLFYLRCSLPRTVEISLLHPIVLHECFGILAAVLFEKVEEWGDFNPYWYAIFHENNYFFSTNLALSVLLSLAWVIYWTMTMTNKRGDDTHFMTPPLIIAINLKLI